LWNCATCVARRPALCQCSKYVGDVHISCWSVFVHVYDIQDHGVKKCGNLFCTPLVRLHYYYTAAVHLQCD